MRYFHLVCNIKQGIATDLNRLATVSDGCPTGTQYMKDYREQEFRDELFVFTSLERINMFVSQALHMYGTSFNVEALGAVSNYSREYYFRNRDSIIWHMMTVNIRQEMVDEFIQYLSSMKLTEYHVSVANDSDGFCVMNLNFMSIVSLNEFLSGAYQKFSSDFVLHSVTGISD